VFSRWAEKEHGRRYHQRSAPGTDTTAGKPMRTRSHRDEQIGNAGLAALA